MLKRIMICLLVLCLCSWGDTLSKGKKDSIVVIDTDVTDSLVQSSKSDGSYMELKRLSDDLKSQLEVAVSATRIFTIVERDQLDKITLEGDLNASGMTDDSADVKQFQLVGASYALLPEITAYELKKAVSEYRVIDRQSSSVIITATLQSKIVNTSKGTALPNIVSVTKSVTQNYDLAKSGTETSIAMLIDKLAQALADETAKQLVNTLRPPKVLAVTAGQVMINRGNNGGFKVGGLVKFYAVEEIRDDDSGELFINEVEVGNGKIIRSDSKQSYAEIMGENLGVAKGCVVRVEPEIKHTQTDSPKGRAEKDFGVRPENEATDKLSPGSSEKPW